jgi:hypothetical protein
MCLLTSLFGVWLTRADNNILTQIGFIVLAVFAGMLGVTLFGLFLTPVFFVTVEVLFGDRRKSSAKGDAEMPASAELAPAAGAREDVPALFATEQSARKRSAKLP